MARVWARACAVLLAASGCRAQNGWIQLNTRLASLMLLPQDGGEQAAACLDGSPYGFYFRPSSTGSTKWTVSMDGGSWCLSEDDCMQRSRTYLGSSRGLPRASGCDCMNALPDGRMDDCNCLHMPYCDGASFAGFRSQALQVPDAPETFVYFRGLRNFDSTLDWAIAHGLSSATEFVLSGVSAGGMAAFLHIDRVADRLMREAPYCSKVVATPFVGYFLDHQSYAHQQQAFNSVMAYLYQMQNITFGNGGVLSSACRVQFPDRPHYCLLAPHMSPFVRTPFFAFSSKYDQWQLENILQVDWASPVYREAVLDFGEDFLRQFQPVRADPKNGAVISSCICHMCAWDAIALRGKLAFQHYADWYLGKTSGAASIHVDHNLPNGNGNFHGMSCGFFPNATLLV